MACMSQTERLDRLRVVVKAGIALSSELSLDAYPYARAHLVDLVDTLRRAALESLNRELAAAAAADPALPATASEATFGKGARAVTPRFGKVVVGYQVPAELPGERLWMGVWGWGEPRCVVELPYPAVQGGEGERRAAAVAALREAGFESWRDKILSRYLPLGEEILSSPDLARRVLSFAGESFRFVAESGVYALASEAPELEEPTEA